MNVFEDLIVELKQENLLESTVIEAAEMAMAFDETEVPNTSFEVDDVETSGGSPFSVETMPSISDEDAELAIHETEIGIYHAPEPIEGPSQLDAAATIRARSEFFMKKAAGEVSSLQMVEHIMTGVEREYLKILPKPFDDFAAKKALSAFLSSDAEIDPEGHASAEYDLVQETEAWCSALAVRDLDVPVFNLRQYCERSRPALSSQALLALGRFYRNLPYSEAVRSKFDFVLTRLFSRPLDREKRVCLFNREEMRCHINTLYSDWSSVPLYDLDDDDSKVMLTALSFEDLAIEAENAGSFDQLIESDFFGRLGMFKAGIAELFYAPQVASSAIDCNIRIGNAYVELIDRERQKLDSASVHLKYGDHDLAVSEVTGKTLELDDLLRQLEGLPPEDRREDHAVADVPNAPEVPRSEVESTNAPQPNSLLRRVRSIVSGLNKWVLMFSALMIAVSVGTYLWATYIAEGEQATKTGVKVFQVANSGVEEYLRAARISGDMMYAQAAPSWERLPSERRRDILQKIYLLAQQNGCSEVSLITTTGKNAGYASSTRVDVVMQ